MTSVELLAFLAGAALATVVLAGAIRTVVVPRAEQVWLVRALFIAMRALFEVPVRLRKDWRAKDRVLARYAPFTLMLLPLLWAFFITIGFAAMFWALDVGSFSDSILLSGSSLTTLGISAPGDAVASNLANFEGLLGLGLVALLISFLPTMYAAFSRREALISRFHVMAEPARSPSFPDGAPPDPETMLTRIWLIGRSDVLDGFWDDWEQFFRELEEAHTTFAALNHFRSIQPNRSWVVSSGVALDTAALYQSTIDAPSSPEAQLMIRSGYTALRRIADVFGVAYDPYPAPTDPIDFERERYDALCARLEASGVPLVSDLDQAWCDFAGWRVNYETAVYALLGLTSAPPSEWFGTEHQYIRPKIFRRGVG
jgi:hypothetical protein